MGCYNTRMVECLLAMVLAWTGARLPQQDQKEQKPPTFIGTSTLVNVPFSVLDGKDRLVINQKKETYTVYEDGKKMDGPFFTAITKVPLRIGLIIVPSNRVLLYFKQQQEAAIAFTLSTPKANSKNRLFLMSFDF